MKTQDKQLDKIIEHFGFKFNKISLFGVDTLLD